MDKIQSSDPRELVFERTVPFPPNWLFRAWTEAPYLMQWFTPAPWKTASAHVDLRVGGASLIVMQGPNGETEENHGVFLEIVPDRKLVFTDAFRSGWNPSDKPFFTGILTFTATPGGGTHYVARARHWSANDAEQHEAMGFHAGWGVATDQMVAMFQRLQRGGR